MAGQIITLTQGPLVTPGYVTMDATQAIDTLGSSGRVSLYGKVYSYSAPGVVDMSLVVQTSMFNNEDSPWVDVGTENFAAFGVLLYAKTDASAELLRYIRFKVTTTNATAAVLEVNGVLW